MERPSAMPAAERLDIVKSVLVIQPSMVDTDVRDIPVFALLLSFQMRNSLQRLDMKRGISHV